MIKEFNLNDLSHFIFHFGVGDHCDAIYMALGGKKVSFYLYNN